MDPHHLGDEEPAAGPHEPGLQWTALLEAQDPPGTTPQPLGTGQGQMTEEGQGQMIVDGQDLLLMIKMIRIKCGLQRWFWQHVQEKVIKLCRTLFYTAEQSKRQVNILSPF